MRETDEAAACPRGVRKLRHQKAYLFGAVCPERDPGVALVLPAVIPAAMQTMLDKLGQVVSPGAHGAVLMDRAGRQVVKDLARPADLTSTYSPELKRDRAGLVLV